MADLEVFYRRQISRGVTGNALYTAYLNLGLINWCFGDESLSDDARRDLERAVAAVVDVMSNMPIPPTRDDLRAFEFTMPLYLTLIFGTEEERSALSLLHKTQWLTQEENEFASYTALMDLIRRHALDLVLDAEEIQAVEHQNNQALTHDFYRPWITAMCLGFTCIIEGDCEGLEAQCEQLLKLLQQEAIHGEWTHDSQSLMAFWPMVLLVFARRYNMSVNVKSAYIPDNLFA